MAYNNIFPIGYQPMAYPQYQIPAQTMQAQQSQPSGSIIWVQGEAGAKSYLVAPNTTVQLWDSENQVIYLKSADATGMPSIKTIDYTIRDMQTPEVHEDYAKKADLDDLKKQLEALKAELSGKDKK